MFAMIDAEITYLYYCYHRYFDMFDLSSTIWIETVCWKFCWSLVRILRFFHKDAYLYIKHGTPDHSFCVRVSMPSCILVKKLQWKVMGHVAFVSLILPSAEFVDFCTHSYISLYTFMPTRPVILSRHFNYKGLYSSHYRYFVYICMYM